MQDALMRASVELRVQRLNTNASQTKDSNSRPNQPRGAFCRASILTLRHLLTKSLLLRRVHAAVSSRTTCRSMRWGCTRACSRAEGCSAPAIRRANDARSAHWVFTTVPTCFQQKARFGGCGRASGTVAERALKPAQPRTASRRLHGLGLSSNFLNKIYCVCDLACLCKVASHQL